jgi:hypothetical protein
MISAPSLASLQMLECQIGTISGGECLHHCLAARPDPTPITNERCTAEQRRLNAEAIEAPHVLCRIDAAKMDRLSLA